MSGPLWAMQPWSEVEYDPKFQALSDQDKVKVRKGYFDRFSKNPEYTALPFDKQKRARYHILGSLILTEIKNAAETGDADAQFEFGRMHEKGSGVPKDYNEAIAWYRKAAKQGNTEAQLSLGYIYSPPDLEYRKSLEESERAERSVAKEAERSIADGDTNAQNLLDSANQIIASSRREIEDIDKRKLIQNPTESLRWFRMAAGQGNVEAQRSLGLRYRNGTGGVPQDKTMAALWIGKAAAKDDCLAEYSLGEMCRDGDGVPQKFSEALNWFEKAAKQIKEKSCAPRAQYAIGVMYKDGIGVAQSDTEASKYFLLALPELSWNEEAMKDICQFAVNGKLVLGKQNETDVGFECETANNLKAALMLYLRSANRGDSFGQLMVGRLYATGTGVTQNYVEAYKWYVLAAAQGQTKASERMADLSQAMTHDQVAEAQKLASQWEPTGAEEKQETADTLAPTPRKSRSENRRPSDIDAPSFTLPPNTNNFALVIGIEKYQKLPAAQFAERDAATMRQYLLRLGYPERSIIHLIGENATRSSLSSYLDEWLPKNVNADSTVFVYFSGHGAPAEETKQAYLVPWDADVKFLQSSAYPLKSLYAALNRLKAKRKIVVLDACFSGTGGRSVLAEGTRPLVTKVAADADLGGVVLFAAAGADEVTGTLNEEGHGIFTYYFLKGLAGKAKGPSGAVTADGLYRYLKPLVQDAAHRQNREQTPMMAGPATGEIVLRK